MTELFFATYAYGELALLTKACKMHGSVSYIAVNTLIELDSNSARYTAAGGKLANWPWVAILIRARCQNQARSHGPPETTRAAIVLLPLACDQFSLLSVTCIRPMALWVSS